MTKTTILQPLDLTTKKPNIEDVQKAVEIIEAYCNEFEASYTQRMEPLTGDEILVLTDDRTTIDHIKGWADSIAQFANKLTFE